MKKHEWDELVVLIDAERMRLMESLLATGIDQSATEFLRGQIRALKWVLALPETLEEEAMFELQREKGVWTAT